MKANHTKPKHFLLKILGAISIMLFVSSAPPQAAESMAFQHPELKAVYDAPATAWESEAMPMGNGYMGAMIFGGVEADIIQVNEHSLWSGGPGANPSYDGGHARTAAQNKLNLQNARNALQQKMSEFTVKKAAYIDASGKVVTNDYTTEDASLKGYINGLMGNKNNFGSYQTLGNINISYPASITPAITNITSDCESSNPSERVEMLFDGNTGTKWYSDAGFKGVPCYIAWQYEKPFSASAYSIVSGNDMPARDPKSWNLYGSNDGVNYTIIDSRNNILFSGRQETKRFTFNEPLSYIHFKIEFTAINTSGNSPQLSEIALENSTSTLPEYSDYQRILDISNAKSTVSYKENGVTFTREYFISYPKNVMAIRISASEPGKLTHLFSLTSVQSKKTISAENGVITMTGQPADQTANGLRFAQQLKVIPSGGTTTTVGDKILVENADEIVLLMSAATNYVQSTDDQFNYFSTANSLDAVKDRISVAESAGYQELLNEHTTDYKSLYERMGIVLSGINEVPDKTTKELLTGYRKTNTEAENLYLEMLYFQFGRYLLISSSRENTLPANLQGIWADGLNPPWAADYHTNINLQMNYWLAQQTNLSSCHLPMISYANSLVPRGRLTAQRYYCQQDGSDVRGWVIHHENNIWGNTAPGNYYEGFYFPAAAAWVCQDIWEYYRYNSDTVFLENNFTTLLDAALFWVDNLWRDARDGSLVANPSYSPEHGNYSLGASCDQAIIWELFDMVIKASDILNKNSSEIEEVKLAKSKMAGPQIGLAGQFMEWKDEITRDVSGDGGHRHVNHLFWLHPGTQVVAGRTAQEDRYIDAMKKTLTTRGDGGTGWSKAWKINFWARLRDGNHAHKMVEEILKESTLQNLFDTHPPFQIDGNFGSTAGMTEMLVQSQGDCIELLPALPQAWNNGTFKGIKARGNFEIDSHWENGEIISASIISLSGNDCVIKYNGIANYSITTSDGSPIEKTIDGNKVSFETKAGIAYIISK